MIRRRPTKPSYSALRRTEKGGPIILRVSRVSIACQIFPSKVIANKKGYCSPQVIHFLSSQLVDTKFGALVICESPRVSGPWNRYCGNGPDDTDSLFPTRSPRFPSPSGMCVTCLFLYTPLALLQLTITIVISHHLQQSR